MTVKKDYELRAFDKNTLAATKKSWLHQIETHAGEILPTAYVRILDWAHDHVDYSCENGNAIAYGIFPQDQQTAVAIVTVSYTKTGRKWLKVLDLDLSPTLDLSFFDDSFSFDVIGGIFAAAILGTIKLTKTAHPAKVTKLYGRSGTALTFFKGFGAAFEKFGGPKGMTVSIEGRWLVFKTMEGGA